MLITQRSYEVYADSFAAESTRAAYPVVVVLTVRRKVVVDHQRHLFNTHTIYDTTRSRLDLKEQRRYAI